MTAAAVVPDEGAEIITTAGYITEPIGRATPGPRTAVARPC